MVSMNSAAGWVQLGFNAAALFGGGVVWKMYIENLKATVSTKDAEIALTNKQVELWRDKANELEKRSPEVVERVLAERIAIREAEIERLANDREHSSLELSRAKQEVALLNRTLDQTKGFREVLAMEQPGPDDPDYQSYLDYVKEWGDEVVEVEVAYLGVVGVDSGQLMITDPCYVDSEWSHEEYQHDRIYKDVESGAIVKWSDDFVSFVEPIESYGKSASALIDAGRLVQIPAPPRPETFNYSYNGACQATSDDGYGEMHYRDTGQPGAGVVFQSGWGDGFYPVYGEKHNGRIMRVYVNLGAEPTPPILGDESLAVD